MVTIRQANLEDLVGLVHLFDAYRIFYRKNSDKKAAEKFLQQRLTLGDAVVFIALDQSDFVGFVNCYFQLSSVQMKSFLILNDLFVDEAHRNLGIGKRLIDRVKQYAVENGLTGIQLETEIDNEAGNHLYVKEGFSRIHHNFYFWNQKVDNV